MMKMMSSRSKIFPLLLLLVLVLLSLSSLASGHLEQPPRRRSVAAVVHPSSSDVAASLRAGGIFGPIRRRHRRRRRFFGNNNKQSSPTANQDIQFTPIPPGEATIPAEVFNLIKSIVGAGVLGLPAGIAAFGNAPSAVLPAMLLLTCIGGLSAYGFSLIGLVCGRTYATSYRQAWSRSVGEGTAWIPAFACLMVTACSVLCYSMILADTIPSIVKALLGIALTRTNALLGITTLVLLPLCLMRSLAALAPFSLLGIMGMVYTSLTMLVRWLSGSYDVAAGGKFVKSLEAQFKPKFGTKGWEAVFSSNSAILVSMLSTAFMAHYNAPKFYWELKDNTIPRFNSVVGLSFIGAIVLMATTVIAGYGTFGGASNSLILNNYAVNDSFMSLSRAAVAMSLIFGYPLAFGGVRDGLLDLLNVPAEKRTTTLSDTLSVGLLILVTALAFVLKDISVILALGGATWGNMLVYIFPTLMLYKTAQKQEDLKKQVPPAIFTGCLGLVLGVVGTARAVANMSQK